MRWSGSPTKRSRRAARSSSPPTGSITAPSAPAYSAFMVKSRRAASSSSRSENSTTARRPSVSTSRRKVVTSKPSPAATTVTVPCSIPVGTTFSPAAAASSSTRSGRSAVAMSMSSTGSPSRAFLTAPPTISAGCGTSAASTCCKPGWAVTVSGRRTVMPTAASPVPAAPAPSRPRCNRDRRAPRDRTASRRATAAVRCDSEPDRRYGRRGR